MAGLEKSPWPRYGRDFLAGFMRPRMSQNERAHEGYLEAKEVYTSVSTGDLKSRPKILTRARDEFTVEPARRARRLRF